jgi:hypothetical protein
MKVIKIVLLIAPVLVIIVFLAFWAISNPAGSFFRAILISLFLLIFLYF